MNSTQFENLAPSQHPSGACMAQRVPHTFPNGIPTEVPGKDHPKHPLSTAPRRLQLTQKHGGQGVSHMNKIQMQLR